MAILAMVKHGLLAGFVLGMPKRQEFGLVLGAQARLFAGGRVLAVKSAPSAEQDKSRFHG